MKEGVFRFNRKGQFFILAAVIIAAVIVSMAAVVNRVDVNQKPIDIYEISEEVEREAGAILDYQVYNDIEGNQNLSTFVRAVAKDIRDKDPNANFIFIYGDADELYLENYASESIDSSDGSIIGGSGNFDSNINVNIGGDLSSVVIEDDLSSVSDAYIRTYEGLGERDFNISVRDVEYEFSVSEHSKLMVIIYKEVGEEVYVVA